MTGDKPDPVDRWLSWAAAATGLAFAGAALVWLLLFAIERAQAQDLTPCIARARVAKVLVLDMAQGVPLDSINVYFRDGNKFSTDEDFVASIREEVRPLATAVPAFGTPELEPYANAIANRVAEACAYKLGAMRRT